MIKKANKKVKNATAQEVDGIKFKTKLEAYMYGLLKRHGIKHQYEGERFTLIDKFSYAGENIRAITYTPDFTGEDFIIETKGFATPDFLLRQKLFKLYCVNKGEDRTYYMPRSQKDCESVMRQILDKRDALPFE